MTRPIVWAFGTMAAAALSATTAGERIASQLGLVATAPAPGAPAEDRRPTTTVAADWRGHFIVHPTLDGRRIRMMVDTGASLVALSHEDAELAGIRVGPRDYTHRVATANGVVAAAPIRIGEVRIGEIAVRNVEALVLPPGKLGTSLLGMSFLKRLPGFEIAKGRLVLKG